MQKNLIRKVGYGIASGLLFTMLSSSSAMASESKPVFQPAPNKNVQYNWGFGAPPGFPVDNFEAKFNQSGHYASGDYFIQTFADDGVKVEVNGDLVIDRWDKFSGTVDRALWLGVKAGQHKVTTDYMEGGYQAAVFSHVVPLNSWLAYYYPNKTLSGMPTTAKVVSPVGEHDKLIQDFGLGSPAPGIPVDHFSARYASAKRMPAGEYVLRAKADDGIRVYVDGKLVVNQWQNGAFREDAVKINIADRTGVSAGEKDIHWIEVEYYDNTYSGKVEVILEPFKKAIEDNWVAEYYPNTTFTGNPVVIGGKNASTKLPRVNFNWIFGSPHPSIRPDHFSARFTKNVYLAKGSYLFNANGDDGIRVFLDDKLVIDAWPNSDFKDKKTVVDIASGRHTIRVEYYENTWTAHMAFDYQRMAEMAPRSIRNVQYNWGAGSPETGIPADNFIAEFDQSGTYAAGDYFIQTFADDGVKVEANGNLIIDRWNKFSGTVDRGLWLGVTDGMNTVKTRYFEAGYGAGVFSHIVPLNSWVAYYYPNTNLSGMPNAAKVIQPTDGQQILHENHGTGSPAVGIPNDNFSARYATAKRIPAGEYVIRARADDGVRVYVDGKLVVNQWDNGGFREQAVKVTIADHANAKPGEEDIHWIDVHYYDKTFDGKVELLLEPFQDYVDNTWVAEFYPNATFQGNPYIIGGVNSLNKLSKVDFNSGNNAPYPFLPVDHFSARYTKKVNFEEGTYVFSANADDGIRVYLDDKLIIDAWSNSNYSVKKEAVFVSQGTHTIKVEYFEKTYSAYLSFDYEKVSSDKIFYEYSKQVQYNWGTGSPANFPIDGFEALFDQSQYLQAGDYFIQTFADDGVKVQVNNNWLINRWSKYTGSVDRALLLGAKSGEHTINTHYYENAYDAAIFSHIVPFDSWLAYYYPNETLSGMPVSSKIIAPVGSAKKLSENFSTNSPAPEVAKDNFSAKYTSAKRMKAGEYVLRTKADDGVRVYIDGVLVLDRWSGAYAEESINLSISDRSSAVAGERDIHWVEVEYREATSAAEIDVSIEQQIGPIYTTTSYNYTFSQMIDIQMNSGPQTDLYTKFLREDALTKDSKGNWIVNGSGWNVRNGPGTTFDIVGTINNATPVWIQKTVVIDGQLNWYQVGAWINPLRKDVEYYANPANFKKGTAEYFQFLRLSESAGLNVNEVNQKILNGKGILQGKGSSFTDAGKQFGINEVYLISHALLETGNGTSALAKGVVVSSVDGKAVEPKTVYNMYGINAKDSCPLQCGSEYAYKQGWTTPELAIVGGAKFIADSYINKGQDTLYKMRWNPAAPGTRQYATDIGWGTKQVGRIKSLYDLLSDYTLKFDTPVFK